MLMLQLPPKPAQYISGWTDMPESSCQQWVCPGDRPTWWILIPSAKPQEKESMLYLNNWCRERLKGQNKTKTAVFLWSFWGEAGAVVATYSSFIVPWQFCLFANIKQTVSECSLFHCRSTIEGCISAFSNHSSSPKSDWQCPSTEFGSVSSCK